MGVTYTNILPLNRMQLTPKDFNACYSHNLYTTELPPETEGSLKNQGNFTKSFVAAEWQQVITKYEEAMTSTMSCIYPIL